MSANPAETLKRITILLPLVVFLALGIGYTLERIARSTGEAFPEILLEGDLALTPLPRVDGDGVLAGRVVDSVDQPVRGADVLVVDGDRTLWTSTDSQGAFQIEGLASRNELEVFALAFGFEQGSTRVQGSAGEAIIALKPAAGVTELPRTHAADLEGNLRASRETAFDQLVVCLRPTRRPDELSGAIPREVRPQSDGSFAFTDLALGSYECLVLPIWAQGSSWPNLLSGEERLIEHGEKTALELRLSSGGISGVLVDQGGKPVEGALVNVREIDRGHMPPSVTGLDGSFAVSDLPPADYEVSVHAGEWSFMTTTTVTEGKVTSLLLPAAEFRRTP